MSTYLGDRIYHPKLPGIRGNPKKCSLCGSRVTDRNRMTYMYPDGEVWVCCSTCHRIRARKINETKSILIPRICVECGDVLPPRRTKVCSDECAAARGARSNRRARLAGVTGKPRIPR